MAARFLMAAAVLLTLLASPMTAFAQDDGTALGAYDPLSDEELLDVGSITEAMMTVPQKIAAGGSGDIKLSFRVTGTVRGCETVVKCGGTELKRIKKRVVTPGEMESVTIKASDVKGDVTVAVEKK